MHRPSWWSVGHTYDMTCDEELRKQRKDEEHDGRGWRYRNDVYSVSKTDCAAFSFETGILILQ